MRGNNPLRGKAFFIQPGVLIVGGKKDTIKRKSPLSGEGIGGGVRQTEGKGGGGYQGTEALAFGGEGGGRRD